jgi:hypothetical protein
MCTRFELDERADFELMRTRCGLNSRRKRIMEKYPVKFYGTAANYDAAASRDDEAQGSSRMQSSDAAGRQLPLRFPPTRAARASRSRGVFLKEAGQIVQGERAHWTEVVMTLGALVVAALALAVCVKTSSVVGSPAIGANPGPAIVAAASVAPPFVAPTKSR